MLANRRDLGEDNVVDASGRGGNLLKVARITEVACPMLYIQTLHWRGHIIPIITDFETRLRALEPHMVNPDRRR